MQLTKWTNTIDNWRNTVDSWRNISPCWRQNIVAILLRCRDINWDIRSVVENDRWWFGGFTKICSQTETQTALHTSTLGNSYTTIDTNTNIDLTLSDAGVWRLNLRRGGTFEVLLVPGTQKMVPQNSPRLRCYNAKRTQKLCATCCNWHLFLLVILASYCSQQGPPS